MEMIEVTEKAKKSKRDLINFDMRIGIHTGPVVAGIVGTKKWQYDIWGDTVNIASGMESNSISRKVNISESTYQAVKDEFEVEYRGEIEIKNRGPVKMYFVC
jgi:class 3 adenylate cyclase